MGNLIGFEKAYNTVMSSSDNIDTKDQQLAALMTRMEITFEIPLLRNLEWEEKHLDVITLYRKISRSRAL